MAYPGFPSNRYSDSDLSDYPLETLHKQGEFVLYRGRPRTGTSPHPPSVLLLMSASFGRYYPVPDAADGSRQ
jgi:hypothetical protein